MQQQVCKKTSLQKNKSAKSLHIQKMIKRILFLISQAKKSIQVCIFQYNNISIFGNKWVMPKALLNQNDYYIWDFYITQHKNITTYL